MFRRGDLDRRILDEAGVGDDNIEDTPLPLDFGKQPVEVVKTYQELRDDPGAVADQIAQALSARRG